MASKLYHFCVLCFLARLHVSLSASEEVALLQSVPDLENVMYIVVDGFPCVRLLNLSGEIGCSNPGRDKVVAPIVRLKNADKLAQLSAILVSLNEFDSFLARVSNDSNFARHIGGVLVESESEIKNGLKGFSPDQKFPQAEFSPYRSINYQWNPIVFPALLSADQVVLQSDRDLAVLPCDAWKQLGDAILGVLKHFPFPKLQKRFWVVSVILETFWSHFIIR